MEKEIYTYLLDQYDKVLLKKIINHYLNHNELNMSNQMKLLIIYLNGHGE